MRKSKLKNEENSEYHEIAILSVENMVSFILSYARACIAEERGKCAVSLLGYKLGVVRVLSIFSQGEGAVTFRPLRSK